MVCKNVQVARPSCSTSGGHPGGGSLPLYEGAAASCVALEEDAVEPVERAAIIEATEFCWVFVVVEFDPV